MKEKLTKEELATNEETQKHIDNVRKFLALFSSALTIRGEEHDRSKLAYPEVQIFAKYTPKLATVTYGSVEYKQFLAEMKPALDHHYRVNRHHPEHFVRGVDDMSLLDLVEMFCDWKAATLRHNDGDMVKSIRVNERRFRLSPQLRRIFFNTVYLLQEKKP